MTQIATVQRLIGKNRAVIMLPQRSACGGGCAGCVGCGTAPVLAEAVNRIHAQPGQRVLVERSARQTPRVAALVYLVPTALFLAGYLAVSALTERVAVSYTVGGLLFLGGMLLAVRYDRSVRKRGGFPFHIKALF